MKNVAIIGGGLGGIASAIRFKARGYDVAIYERLNELGGRAQKFSKDGYLHDAGPTVITAPYLFNELFSLLNEDIDNYVTFQPLDPWYRFYFNDGTEFDYGPDREKMLEQIDQISPKDVDGYIKMLKRAEVIFELGYEKLASEPFNKIYKMLRYGPDIIRLGGYESVYTFVSRYLKHPNLRQAFSIQPLLVGGNPFTTSSIYALIHALEQKWGISFVMGGTNHLILELRKLMERHDIKIHLQHDVDEFITNKNSIQSVKFLNGKEVKADIIVSNADPIQVNTEFLKNSKISWHNQILKKYAKHSMGLFVLFFGSKNNTKMSHTIQFGWALDIKNY